MVEDLHPELFPDRMLLLRINPEHNMRRFYYLTVQPDLFGGATLVKEWGRLGSSGQMRLESYPDEATAVTELSVIARNKRRRGYNENTERASI